jgi:formylglycine-generating enzyme required for sulfatase activity
MMLFKQFAAADTQATVLAGLRQFMVEFFSRDELDLLCADYFRDVYQEIEGLALPKSALAQKLVDHCRRRKLIARLQAALQKCRPEAYVQHFALLPVVEPTTQSRDARRAFISYAHEDAQLARKLSVDLRAHGYDVWMAPDSIHPGESWVSAIDRGLHECGIFLSLLSPAAVKSPWVKSETRVAIQLEHQRKLRLLPVLVKPCDPAHLSAFLASYQVISLNGRYGRGVRDILAELDGKPRKSRRLTDNLAETPHARSALVPAHLVRSARPARAVPVASRLLILDPIRLELVRIPTGSFWMGSHLARDPQAQPNERPRHRVKLSEYYIGRYPITNEQYDAYARATQRAFKVPSGKANHPVVNVSWEDAQAFCEWMSAATSKRIMLPSEAEWEKAARGADGRIYPWGDRFDGSRVNSVEAGPRDTLAVGALSPKGDSRYGVADLCGNTWEWCDDWFDDETYARRARGRAHDPLGPPQGNLRALRGGAFDFDQHAVRCAYRAGAPPYERNYDYGFRVVMRP